MGRTGANPLCTAREGVASVHINKTNCGGLTDTGLHTGYQKAQPSGVDAVCGGNFGDDLGSMETGSGLVGNSRGNIDWSSLFGNQ